MRRGSALIVAMLVVTSVAILSVGVLRLLDLTTRRQSVAADDRQAFYLAEAGLAESYVDLATGGTGRIGSINEPTRYGGGLVWVDRFEPEEGEDPDELRLRATALYGRGRSSLEIVVRRVVRPFGVFADEEINLDVPVLIDGFDSETSDYFEQAGLPTLTVDPDDPGICFDDVGVLCYDGWFYKVESFVPPGTYHWQYRFQEGDDDEDDWLEDPLWALFGDLAGRFRRDGLFGELTPMGRFLRHDLERSPGELRLEYPERTDDAGDPADPSSFPYHSSAGGSLGSNGPISVSSAEGGLEIYGDLVPGPGYSGKVGAGASVTGEVLPREAPLELPSVRLPGVTMLPGLTHSDDVPRVLPAADVGYDFLTVAPDAEIVVQGPGNLVLGDLTLEAASRMTIDNLGGAVNLYITNSAVLDPASFVDVLGEEPSGLSLQVAGDVGPISLHATSGFRGMVYGPQAEISVGSDFEIFGALAGRRLDISPYARLHFDSGVLGDSGAVPLPEFVGWKIEELPVEVRDRGPNPYRLLDVDENVLEDLATAGVSESWTVKVAYYQGFTQKAVYEGPAEGWDAGASQDGNGYYFTFLDVTSPEDGDPGWEVYMRYRDTFGTKEYSGELDGLRWRGGWECLEWSVTAP
ncbi:MAG: hypothetical protein AAF682_04250 [Planctomycetota bacterium]